MTAADVTAITSAVSFTTVLVGISAVFALMAGVRVAMAGGRKLLSVIK